MKSQHGGAEQLAEGEGSDDSRSSLRPEHPRTATNARAMSAAATVRSAVNLVFMLAVSLSDRYRSPTHPCAAPRPPTPSPGRIELLAPLASVALACRAIRCRGRLPCVDHERDQRSTSLPADSRAGRVRLGSGPRVLGLP